jgi:hypothetical protein
LLNPSKRLFVLSFSILNISSGGFIIFAFGALLDDKANHGEIQDGCNGDILYPWFK